MSFEKSSPITQGKKAEKERLFKFLVSDKNACKKITLEDLKNKLNVFTEDEDKNLIFFMLKQFESNLIDITSSPKGVKQSKIDRDSMKSFLKEEYGLIGLINQVGMDVLVKSENVGLQPGQPDIEKAKKERYGLIGLIDKVNLEVAFGPDDPNLKPGEPDIQQAQNLAPFMVLQKLLQENPEKHMISLELLNDLIKNKIILIPQPEPERGMKIDSLEFIFEDNALHLSLQESVIGQPKETQTNVLPLDDIASMNQPASDEETEKLLQDIKQEQKVTKQPEL
jgi:hypothetical protein